ncbi:uncharacterized protein C8R40DRAFT_30896 [Lentinula edodes]|uniref:uncharacterized protein n=1 Tax=Lentinula edodes TaxID=5353 RepID=UPI001E8D0B3F|nr:uncharacterized protein C8R40DRAFT_30896 [Lentinula edodes]KAH7881295.1 hypothetical protein C8R40DRAFT_30896 [Lentinula edodes]
MRAAFLILSLGIAVSARPMRRDATALQNGRDAISLNAQYKTLSATSSCTSGENSCVTGKFAQCVNGKFVLQSCATGTICAAIPLDSPSTGTLTTCTTQSDLDNRLAATGATDPSSSSSSSSSGTTAAASSSVSSATDNATSSSSANTTSGNTTNNSASGNPATASNNTSTSSGSTGATDNSASGSAVTTSNGSTGSTSTATTIGSLSSSDITTNATENNPDAQSSLTLDPRVIATGFLNNGQDVQEAGQVASLTSNNNFINYCLTQGNLPITNGLQITTGSCNPAPIGTIPSVQNMPSAKFANPANGATIAANTEFTITMNINNLDTGNFVNANENYFAAPQQLSAQGQIIGHTHVVIEALSDLAQTTPTNPQQFAFFKGVNTAAVNGAVTADVTSGVPAGAYRLCSINSSSNHQPVIVPIAQHGSLDDCVYFTASGDGATASNATAAAAGTAAAGTAATGASAAEIAKGQGQNKNQGSQAQSQAAVAKAGNGKGKRSISRL